MIVKETSENFNDLLRKIDELGPIKSVVNNENLLNQIIAYGGDRHLICALFARVNEGLKDMVISEEDLTLFRNGTLINSIINLKETTEQYGGREPFAAERLDKINYISTIDDDQTKAVSYTHPKIIDALCLHSDDYDPRDLTWFITSGTFDNLSDPVKLTIISSVLGRGDIEVAKSLLNRSKSNLKTYEELNNINSKTL